jgi:hypothetical protein
LSYWDTELNMKKLKEMCILAELFCLRHSVHVCSIFLLSTLLCILSCSFHPLRQKVHAMRTVNTQHFDV